jgi:hypothetical protein
VSKHDSSKTEKKKQNPSTEYDDLEKYSRKNYKGQN